VQVVGEGLVGVQDAAGVQQGLDVAHELDGGAGLAVVDVVPLLEAQAVLGAHAAPPARRPLVHEGLDGGQQRGVSRRRRDVKVEVTIT